MSFQGCISSNIYKPERYCSALQQLLDEHLPIKKLMDQIYHTASQLAYEPARSDKEQLLQILFSQMETLRDLVEPHSIKEDLYLFDIVAKYLGEEEDGPVELMEKEHHDVKENLAAFFNKYSKKDIQNNEDIRELAHYSAVVFHVLTDHFLKEEEILFPIAENILREEEKEKIAVIFNDMSFA